MFRVAIILLVGAMGISHADDIPECESDSIDFRISYQLPVAFFYR